MTPLTATATSRASVMSATLRAEWIKLRTLRATYLAAATALVLGLGIGLLDVLSVTGRWATMSAAARADFDPVGDPLSGFQFGELAVGALGVLAISTEYATGMMRTTLTAIPRRGLLYAAKALVLGTFALLLSQVCAFGTFLLGQLVLRRRHLDVSLTNPHVLRAVGCAGLYMTVIALVGFGLGALLRHTAAALATLFALVFLAYPVARTFEGTTFLPDHLALINAASVLATVNPATGPHAGRTPSLGFALFDLVLYLAVFLGLGALRARRDT